MKERERRFGTASSDSEKNKPRGSTPKGSRAEGSAGDSRPSHVKIEPDPSGTTIDQTRKELLKNKKMHCSLALVKR